DNRDTLRGTLFREFVTCLGMYGAVHGDYAAGPEPGQYSVVAAGDLLDVGVTHHAQADEIAGGGEFGRRSGDVGGGAGERLQCGRAARPQRGREPGFDDASGHRAALAAQPYEPDVHQPASKPLCLLRVWAFTHSSANERTVE